MIAMKIVELRARLKLAINQYVELDLRWSYLIIAGLIVIGIIVNCLLPHGWTIWPFIASAGLMLMVNEAATRNGHGVPPMRVYALFASAIAIWIAVVVLLSALNIFIIIAGIGVVLYYAIRAQIQQRERNRLIAFRRENRLCIHCGQPADPDAIFCENCGEEPNPEVARMHRVASMARGPDSAARARAKLTPAPETATVKAKEAALLQRRQRFGNRHK
jgi:hypothetical protein